MKRGALAAGAAAAMAAMMAGAAGPQAQAQPRIAGGAVERRTVAGEGAVAIDREVAVLATRPGGVWMAYRLTTIPSPRQMCPGSHVALDRTTELVVMARLEAGRVQRLRSFTPECEVEVGSSPLVWLDGVSVNASAAWLTTLVRSPESRAEWRSQVADPALAALGLNAGSAATQSLLALARDDERSRVRSQALVWLAQRATAEAVPVITRAIDNDPETEVKRQAVYALSRLPADQGVPLLIQVARTHRNLDVRRQAILYLGRSDDRRAVEFFESVLK